MHQQGALFALPPAPPPRPRHYAALMAGAGLRYGQMDRAARGRLGALAARMLSNGVPEARITGEAARLRLALGRHPTLAELAGRLLG